MRRAILGLTLIELIAALAVLAVLGTLTYRGTAQLLETRTRIDAELIRWRELGRALQIMETELFQIVAPHEGYGRDAGASSTTLHWSGLPDRVELVFLAMGGDATVDLITFRQVGDRILWLRRTATQPSAASEEDVLIERVDRLQLRFLSVGQWSDQWPRPDSQDSLPAAVEIRLELHDLGTVVRTHALR